ncbi:MAG: hypothetical protein ACI9F9_002495, partial [Candidatus Paceibacteria bacterium]
MRYLPASSLFACLLVIGPLSAQVRQGGLRPITSQVQDAGTYHVATGTWTRATGSTALAGPDVIYDNTCTVGYYVRLNEGEVALDSGRIPSTSSPSNSTSLTGTANSYNVNGFKLSYCSAESPTSFSVGFTDCYSACDNPGTIPAPLVTISLVNMPGGNGLGSLGCW